jgi:hypothetical protein
MGSDARDAFLQKRKQNQTRVAEQIELLTVSKTQLFVFSLEPEHHPDYRVNTETVFQGFAILGKAEIAAEAEKTSLLTAFTKGVSDSDGIVAACFIPRHGLRLIVDSRTNDFTICFQCRSVSASGFNNEQGFGITGSSSNAFNDVIDKHHLKKTDK